MFRALFLVLCLAIMTSTAFAKKNYSTIAPYVPGEIIVKLRPDLKATFLQKKNQFELLSEFSTLAGEFVVVKTPSKFRLTQALNHLMDDESVIYAEPNYIYTHIQSELTIQDMLRSKLVDLGRRTSDPKFDDLWGLKNTGNNEPTSSGSNSSASGMAGSDINAIKAWGITKGDKRIKIAVIDTGVDYNHKDLRNNIWINTKEANGRPGVDDDGNGYIDDIHGYDFANSDGDPMDGNGHGTHCAGTIAAEHDNGVGIAGVMAHAQIVGVKFLTDAGSGTTEHAIKAIDYATKIGVDIMSNSWGGGGFSQALSDAIETASNAGIIFTAAAGNSSSDNNSTPQYPASYDLPNIISVAAHNYSDQLASFSCYGSMTVHVAAPGRNILSTVPGNKYDVYSGTSMATPHVSGVVGLYLAEHGRQDPETLRNNLMKSSVYSANYARTTIGGGRVDAYNFLQGIVTPRPAKPDPKAWVSKSVDLFESAHPYADSKKAVKTYRVSGAKFMRLRINKYDIEKHYDSLTILDRAGNVIQTIDGKGSDFVSEYVDGDSLTVEFESDTSVNEWGYEISELDYIK